MTLGVMTHLCHAVITVSVSRCHVTGTEAESQLIRHRLAVRHGTGETLRCTVYSCTVVTTGNVHCTLSSAPETLTWSLSRGEGGETRMFGHLFNWVIKRIYLTFQQFGCWVAMFLLPRLHGTEHGAGEHHPVANPDDSCSFLPPPPSPAWLATPHFPQLGLRWNVIIMPRSEAHTPVSHTPSGHRRKQTEETQASPSRWPGGNTGNRTWTGAATGKLVRRKKRAITAKV